jgi:ribonuclease VapC
VTIVADTSALVAVVFGEPDSAGYAAALGQDDVLVSIASLTEALMVVQGRQGADAVQDLRLLVNEFVAEVVPLDAAHAEVAFAAWQRFGKRRHPAALNLGDCFSYATARLAGAPLLFKGDDFSQTDIPAAL